MNARLVPCPGFIATLHNNNLKAEWDVKCFYNAILKASFFDVACLEININDMWQRIILYLKETLGGKETGYFSCIVLFLTVQKWFILLLVWFGFFFPPVVLHATSVGHHLAVFHKHILFCFWYNQIPTFPIVTSFKHWICKELAYPVRVTVDEQLGCF